LVAIQFIVVEFVCISRLRKWSARVRQSPLLWFFISASLFFEKLGHNSQGTAPPPRSSVKYLNKAQDAQVSSPLLRAEKYAADKSSLRTQTQSHSQPHSNPLLSYPVVIVIVLHSPHSVLSDFHHLRRRHMLGNSKLVIPTTSAA